MRKREREVGSEEVYRCDERKMSVERCDVGREEKWRLRNEESEQEMSTSQRKGSKEKGM